MGKKGSGSAKIEIENELRKRRGPVSTPKASKASKAAEPKKKEKDEDEGKALANGVDEHAGDEVPSNLEGDYLNLAILIVLYTLQGLPMGLAAVLPMIMKERGVSFTDVGIFSLNTWPFSLKLFWAPLVDTWYLPSLGRRKTWVIPAQLLIGAVMLGMSTCVDSLLYTDAPAIYTLTGLFFLLYFLCATQDIAVDGWALTMLKKENDTWAATANAFGQTLGYALGFSGYMVLEQREIVTLASFMFGLGVVFIVVTVLVAVFKNETPLPPEEEPEDLATSYKQMLSILKLKPVQQLLLILATWKMAFPITDAIAPLKLQEYGVPKEHLAYMASIMMPLYITLPVIAANWTKGKFPMDLAMKAYPFRVFSVALVAVVAYVTPASVSPIPYGFYAVVMMVTTLAGIASEFIFVSQMAFFARVSDPALGGTYMTLLNTIGNLGGKWPPTVAFYMVDKLTCTAADCSVQRDGFYVMAAICSVVGAVWYIVGKPMVDEMQRKPLAGWRVR